MTLQSNQDKITCSICGATDVPDWDGQGHCIKCARDLVLGASPDKREARILGHQRIFQSVFNDLKMRHEIVTREDGTKSYAYVYDGIDPYELEDGAFPETVKAILSTQDTAIQAVLGEIEAEIDHKIMVTNIHNIEPLKNGQYIRVDNMRKAIARLKKKYE